MSEEEPIRYVGKSLNVNHALHDGGLEPAVGVHTWQVHRGNASHPPDTGHRGNRYNHQPMLAYWRGRFYLEFLAAPRNEHDHRTETFLSTSADGCGWDAPSVIFPAIPYETWHETIAHQRVGFFVAPSGRLLVLAFYGMPYPHKPHRFPNYGHGVGRAVREIYPDGTLGPIYFLRYMPKTGFDEERCNQWYPHFRHSPDPGFVESCHAILEDKLFHQQMWEEDRNNEDGFFALHWENSSYPEGKALSYWTCPDGTVAGIWKGPYGALSRDRGQTWTNPVLLSTLHHNTSKYWGQRTPDGKYALVYSAFNRGEGNSYRTPLVVITGEDGLSFDHAFLVMGEIPPQRYSGALRNLGSQYVRGIVEGNGNPPGNYFWVTYSLNKEDIWVSRIPVPATDTVPEAADDDFSDTSADLLDRWNVFSGIWARIRHGGAGGRPALVLEDEDPWNYAKAVRVFPEAERVTLRFNLRLSGPGEKACQIDVAGREGKRPVRLELRRASSAAGQPEGDVHSLELSENEWHSIVLTVDCGKAEFKIKREDGEEESAHSFAEPCGTVKRIEFRTGDYRMLAPYPDFEKMPTTVHDRPGTDDPVPLTRLAIGYLQSAT